MFPILSALFGMYTKFYGENLIPRSQKRLKVAGT